MLSNHTHQRLVALGLVGNAHRLALTGYSMRKITAQRANLDATQKTDPIPHAGNAPPAAFVGTASRLDRTAWSRSVGIPAASPESAVRGRREVAVDKMNDGRIFVEEFG
jgi:hypothetical protein